LIFDVLMAVAFAIISAALAVSVRLMTEDWGKRISQFLTGVVLFLTSAIFYSRIDSESSDLDLLVYATAFFLPLIAMYSFLFWRFIIFSKEGDDLRQRSFWVWFDDHRDFSAFKVIFFISFLALARIISEVLGFGEGVGGIILIVGIPVVLLITVFRLALQEEHEIVEEMNFRLDDIFLELLEEDLPDAIDEGLCFVQFQADWCKACKPMTLTLRSVLRGRDDVQVFYVDAEKNEGMLKRFKVKFLPSIVILWNGETVAEITGRRSQSDLRRLIKQHTTPLPVVSF
jgi:thiol:disulfide interchange protein